MSTRIRLAAGTVDGATFLSDDSYLITNFPRQNDMTPSNEWLATQVDQPALQTFVQSLEVGQGQYYGKFSTVIQFLTLSEDQRFYLHNTIMAGNPVAPITCYVEHPFTGFNVFTGEIITPYAANTGAFVRERQELYTVNQYVLSRLSLVSGVSSLGLSDGTGFKLSDGSKLVIG